MADNTKTAWAHLPNAAHVDRVLAHMKKHPHKWAKAWRAARRTASATARYAALDAVSDTVWDEAWHSAMDAAWRAALDAAWALIAWDESSALLSMPPVAVKALVDKGVVAAVLLYPAVLVMQGNDKGEEQKRTAK